MNRYLTPATELAISKQIAKVHRGLGSPEPPLDLAQVCELLRLDRGFYSVSDDGALRETVSRIRVGAIQILKRPALLVDAIRQLSLKALYIPDRRRVLLDADLPSLKIRWNSAHEIVHSVCDWHDDLMYGDTDVTVSQACWEQMEAEANYGAGRLLFMGDAFDQVVLGQELGLKGLADLAKTFGNTWTSTLWRAVEAQDVPVCALIGSHPHHDPGNACRYFVRSREFARRFSTVDEQLLLGVVQSYCRYSTRGPIGTTDHAIYDDVGDAHEFRFESFATPYDCLTLAQCCCRRARSFPVVATPARAAC